MMKIKISNQKKYLIKLVSIILLVQVSFFSFASTIKVQANPAVVIPFIVEGIDTGITALGAMLVACGISNCLPEPDGSEITDEQRKQATVYYLEEYKKANSKKPEDQNPDEKTIVGAWSVLLSNITYQMDVDSTYKVFMSESPEMTEEMLKIANIYKGKNDPILDFDTSCDGSTSAFFNPYLTNANPVTIEQIRTSGYPYIIYKSDFTGTMTESTSSVQIKGANLYVKMFYDKNVRIIKNDSYTFDFNISDVNKIADPTGILNKSSYVQYYETDLEPLHPSNYYSGGIFIGNINLFDFFKTSIDNLNNNNIRSGYGLFNVQYSTPYTLDANSPSGYVNSSDKIMNPNYTVNLVDVIDKLEIADPSEYYSRVGLSPDGFGETTVTAPKGVVESFHLPDSLPQIGDLPLNVTDTGLVTVATPSTVSSTQPQVSTNTTPTPAQPSSSLDWSTRNDEGELDFSPLFADLRDKFPFCIPFDLAKIIGGWNVEKAAPVFQITIPGTLGGSFTFDFTRYEKIILIFRYFVLVAFVLFLLKQTKNLMGGQ